MQVAADFALSQNGTVVIEELPSWQAFFSKYVLSAEAVSTYVSVYLTLFLTFLFVSNFE